MINSKPHRELLSVGLFIAFFVASKKRFVFFFTINDEFPDFLYFGIL